MSGIVSSFFQPFLLEETYGQTTSSPWPKHWVPASLSFQDFCENIAGGGGEQEFCSVRSDRGDVPCGMCLVGTRLCLWTLCAEKPPLPPSRIPLPWWLCAPGGVYSLMSGVMRNVRFCSVDKPVLSSQLLELCLQLNGSSCWICSNLFLFLNIR